MPSEWSEIDRLPHLIMKYQPCGNRSQGLLMGQEQVTEPKTLQVG
jgi:hypothetical protein